MAPRKQMSSSQKRDKRKCDAQLVESQRNALHKFFVGSSNVDVNEVEDNEDDDPMEEEMSDDNFFMTSR
jgi:hypothetical protein